MNREGRDGHHTGLHRGGLCPRSPAWENPGGASGPGRGGPRREQKRWRQHGTAGSSAPACQRPPGGTAGSPRPPGPAEARDKLKAAGT